MGRVKAEAIVRYGVIPFEDGTTDVTQVPCLSVDLRREFGGNTPDESQLMPPGTFTRALFGQAHGEPPVGEVRMLLHGVEVRLVAETTTRPGVIEMTPPMIRYADQDAEYRSQWLFYLAGRV